MRSRRRSRVPSLLIAFVLTVAWWVLLAPPAFGGKTSYISVSGKSMEPTYVTGDLVVVREQGSYTTGDIVAFRAQGGVVIHRIIGGDGTNGYELQGDNNDWVDPWNPTDAEVVGKAWFRLPGASKWLLSLTHPVVLAIVVTAPLAWTMIPSSASKKTASQPAVASPSRRAMQFDDYRRALAAVSRRTLTVAALAIGAALVLAVPAALAWLDDTERTSFREDARYVQSADFAYTFRLEPTTLYPDGVVGPIDATSEPPAKVFAKPAHTLDVVVDYRFAGADSDVSGTYAVDAIVVGDAGWETAVSLLAQTSLSGLDAHIELPLDLRGLVALAEQIDEEAGTSSRSFEVKVSPTFTPSGTVSGHAVTETFAPQLVIAYDGSTWAVTSELRAEQTERLGEETTERVELAGLPVEHLRWLAVPAGVLLVLGITIVTVAMRRTPSLTIEALLRRPGISVIDLEQPPADAANAVPLANPEGIRRVAERDGGLVLRYDEGGNVHLYARHDDRVYSYTPDGADR